MTSALLVLVEIEAFLVNLMQIPFSDLQGGFRSAPLHHSFSLHCCSFYISSMPLYSWVWDHQIIVVIQTVSSHCFITICKCQVPALNCKVSLLSFCFCWVFSTQYPTLMSWMTILYLQKVLGRTSRLCYCFFSSSKFQPKLWWIDPRDNSVFLKHYDVDEFCWT